MLGSRVRSPPVRPFDEANDQDTTVRRAFRLFAHNLHDHAGRGTRRTLARNSPHDPRGCFAVGVRPVDISHHGQLVRAGECAGTLTFICKFAYSQIQCVMANHLFDIQIWKFRNIKRVLINDLNERLVTTYKVVRDHPKDLIAALHDIQTEYYACSCESERCDVYFKCLERFNGGILSNLSVAALFIFLNRTCFNGLYRVNSKGQFNVSFGKSVHPLICDEATIFGDSELLQHVEIRCGDFSTVGSCVSAPAFYYIDPPYRPLTKTSAFTGYSEKGFDQECQIRLASFCRELSANGIC